MFVLRPTVPDYVGAWRSPESHPAIADFIGSVCTWAWWILPHEVHLNVQCSKPERPGVVRWTMAGASHWGQRRLAAVRGEKVDI
jgi:hypothetical protein